MSSNELKGKIVARGMNVGFLAEKIGMDKSTFYRKLNNFESFTIGEAIRIKAVLELSESEAIAIFLT